MEWNIGYGSCEQVESVTFKCEQLNKVLLAGISLADWYGNWQCPDWKLEGRSIFGAQRVREKQCGRYDPSCFQENYRYMLLLAKIIRVGFKGSVDPVQNDRDADK